MCLGVCMCVRERFKYIFTVDAFKWLNHRMRICYGQAYVLNFTTE